MQKKSHDSFASLPWNFYRSTAPPRKLEAISNLFFHIGNQSKSSIKITGWPRNFGIEYAYVTEPNLNLELNLNLEPIQNLKVYLNLELNQNLKVNQYLELNQNLEQNLNLKPIQNLEHFQNLELNLNLELNQNIQMKLNLDLELNQIWSAESLKLNLSKVNL